MAASSMRQRPITKLRPGLERFEEKRLLSAGPSTAHLLNPETGPGAPALLSTGSSGALGAVGDLPNDHARPTRPSRSNPTRDGALTASVDRGEPPSPSPAFTLFRITNT